MAGGRGADKHGPSAPGKKLQRGSTGRRALPSDKDLKSVRKVRQGDAGIIAPELPSMLLPMKYIALGMLAVALVCSWQFVLLNRSADSPSTMHLTSVGSLLEANISALAAQQKGLVSLVVRLSEEMLKEHDEIQSLRARLGPTGQPPADKIAELRDMVSSLKASAPSGPQLRGSAAVLPRPKPGGFPQEWLQKFSQQELEASAKEAEKWRDGVKGAFQHVWRNYRKRAWGLDEIRPVSGAEGRRWGNMGLMILDSLSTMWVMGLKEEFDEAEKWVETSLSFENSGFVSFFETTIRALGGLCSAHALSGRPVFLKRAQELADRMLPAFAPHEPAFPASQVDLGAKPGSESGKQGWFGGAVLAEVGTVQLEFRYVSQMTGNPIYGEKADASMRSIIKAANGKGLIPWGLSRTSPTRFVNSHVTMGAMGDSYYEYLIKTYVQTDHKEVEWKDVWKKAMSEMQQRLVRKTQGGLTYVSDEQNEFLTDDMGHLACFIGGNLIYGSRHIPETERDASWERDAAEITETCFQFYHRSPTHVGPEVERFIPKASSPGDMEIQLAHSLLRPEVIESIFYMLYYTGDPKYRRMCGEIFEGLEKYTRTTYGYGGLYDVRQTGHAHVKDEMETFFLAETLKYLYLCFSENPRETLDLEEFVFNTEAHPIRIFRGKQ